MLPTILISHIHLLTTRVQGERNSEIITNPDILTGKLKIEVERLRQSNVLHQVTGNSQSILAVTRQRLLPVTTILVINPGLKLTPRPHMEVVSTRNHIHLIIASLISETSATATIRTPYVRMSALNDSIISQLYITRNCELISADCFHTFR